MLGEELYASSTTLDNNKYILVKKLVSLVLLSLRKNGDYL